MKEALGSALSVRSRRWQMAGKLIVAALCERRLSASLLNFGDHRQSQTAATAQSHDLPSVSTNCYFPIPLPPGG